MAKKTRKAQPTPKVTLDESSIYGKEAEAPGSSSGADTITLATLERLEAVAGGADEDDPLLLDRDLGRQFDALQATTEEEVDALRVNLVQDEGHAPADSSGQIVDEVAEVELARFTEVGPMQPEQGAEPVEPGRDDTSRILRRHHLKSGAAGTLNVVEGNLDEPRDEEVMDRKVDEGTAA